MAKELRFARVLIILSVFHPFPHKSWSSLFNLSLHKASSCLSPSFAFVAHMRCAVCICAVLYLLLSEVSNGRVITSTQE